MGDSNFTIPYPEYDIADKLQKAFPKRNNFSVAIPFSRQQKFYDLLLLNGESMKSVTIQVKSSRTYVKHSVKSEFQFDSLLNCFDIKDNYSQFYFIYITYPLLDKEFSPRAKWERKILVFNHQEMEAVLSNVQTKSGKPERFFGFGFNMPGTEIFGWRGFKHLDKRDYSDNLFEKKVAEIKSRLI